VTFEAYCKELIQEVLSNKPSYFLGIGTSFSGKLNPFIDANDGYNHEVFSGCGIRYRKDFLAFFDEYKIPFLIPEEVAFLEKVYDLRNTIIHDSGNNQRIKLKIEELIRKTSNTYMLATLAKRFRTEFDRIIRRAEKRVRGELRGRT
jgi:hypothetical protein